LKLGAILRFLLSPQNLEKGSAILLGDCIEREGGWSLRKRPEWALGRVE
jgi:hypothetical protein